MHFPLALGVLGLVAYNTVQVEGECCIPNQFQAFQGHMTSKMKNGKFSTEFGTTIVVWDGVANKTYFDENLVEDGIPSRKTTIKDYPAKTMYTIEGGLCKPTPLTTSFDRGCVPSSAPVMTNVMFGNSALPVTVFNITSAAGSDFILSQTGNCYPVMTVQNAVSPPSMKVVVYMNVTSGPPSNPAVFTIPSSCSGAGLGVG